MTQQAASGAEAKSIILFSDGTGNSSAKLFKTNVWRMYEAIDLGPSPTGTRDQISFYDDGVGTSNFKVFAALGGAFGQGLKRNVLDLYRYACRNYCEGDRIYAFGFSRGAFTIRIVVALIASQGLVQSDDESELNRKSIEAYKAFHKIFHIRKFKLLRGFLQRVRQRVGAVPKPYDNSGNLKPKIHFVGVWDTVAAYGGPIAEITRAIDNWIYPLSMPDYELDEKVQCARHALAIDDERDAFQPVLWDELAEERRANEAAAAKKAARASAKRAADAQEKRTFLAEAKTQDGREKLFRNRMQQVWFTGMHADVGGGYPDESLSYVSLLWMMEEAEKQGLRTLPSIKDRFFALANSYGPMHDSRAGFSSYYRYQPRKIAAWLDSPADKDESRYLMLRDPDIRDADGNPRGLLRTVRVHESVIARIFSGTVRYAPIALPAAFEVIPPQREGEKVEQTDGAFHSKCKYDRPPSEPLISDALREIAERPSPGRFAGQENLWDLVWKRRIAYFATLIVTLLIVALPVWVPIHLLEATCSDSRCWLRNLIGSAKLVVPGFADPFVDAIAQYPITAAGFVLLLVLVLRWGRSLEARLADGSYRLWRRTLDGIVIDPVSYPKKRLQRFRESASYQKLFQQLKWRFLPGLCGLVMILMILYVPLVLLTQGSLQVTEADHSLCAAEHQADVHKLADQEKFDFDARSPCMPTHLWVDKGQSYEIVFQLPVKDGEAVPFLDHDIASAKGPRTSVRASSLFQLLGIPMRRVINAGYLQPLAQITKVDNPWSDWIPAMIRNRLPEWDRVHVTELDLKQDEHWPELYRATFTPTYNGSLHLFSNEAQLPFGFGKSFYRNNCGVAKVTIIHIVRQKRDAPAQDLMSQPDPDLAPPDCAKHWLEKHQTTPAP